MGGMGKGKKNKKGRKVGMLRPKEKKTEGRLRQLSFPIKNKFQKISTKFSRRHKTKHTNR